MFRTTAVVSLVLLAASSADAATSKKKVPQYSSTYIPGGPLPNHSEGGQMGTNNCGTTSSQGSLCQNAYINGVRPLLLPTCF